MMVRFIGLVALIWILVAPTAAVPDESHSPLRVLLTVGGVGYHTSIVRMLESNENIEVIVRDADKEALLFTADTLAGIDAVLMYHRDNVAEPEEREALLRYVRNGGGIVVLHHAIANYPDWETWWREHVGGLYVLADHEGLMPSRYFDSFSGVARPALDHPVTNRLGAFWRVTDESYDRLWVSDDVTVLLTTTAFGSDARLAWIGTAESERVVFIQPGHGERVLTDPKYLMLIEDALRWTARNAS